MRVGDDYVDCPVPLEGRRAWWSVLAVWVGFIIVVGIMAVGGGIAAGMAIDQLILAVLVGNVLLGSLAAVSGYVAAQSGESFVLLIGRAFPGASEKVVALYAPVTLVGWYAIECAIFGGLLGHALDLSEFQARIAMALSAILFSVTCYIGIRAIHWASVVFIPAILILGLLAIFQAYSAGSAEFGNAGPMSFDEGLGLVVGSWALGVVAAYPDIARFAKTPMTGALLGFLGILIFNSLALLIGAAAAGLTGEYDPALILLSLGAPMLALLLGVSNIWTTNDSNLYSASLGLAKVLPIDRKTAVVICAALGLVIAFFNPAQFSVFFTFLGVLGTTAPALGGVVFGAYILRRSVSGSSSLPGWLGWGAGSLASLLSAGIVSVPLGFFAGFLAWFVFSKYVFSR